MFKKELCTFAVALSMGLAVAAPVTTFATETKAQELITNKKEENQKRKGQFEEKMKNAREKWNALSDKQKNEVYGLLEQEVEVETKLFKKLVDFGVMEKEDADKSISYLKDCLKRLKESKEFPFGRSKK